MLLKWGVASTLYVGAWCLILQLQLMITTVQTQAPNESLLCKLGPPMNHYCADSGPKLITTVQTLASNESLLGRLGPQINHYCADSGSQMNHYCADSGPKWITTVQTRASNESLLCRLGLPNESILCRLGFPKKYYCSDSGSKCHWHKMAASYLEHSGFSFLQWKQIETCCLSFFTV